MAPAAVCGEVAPQSSQPGGRQHILLQKCFQQPGRSAQLPFSHLSGVSRSTRQ